MKLIRWMIEQIWPLATLAIVTALFLVGRACSEVNKMAELARKKDEEKQFNGPCRDASTLVATTAGSPNYSVCTNRLHRMHVEPVTRAGEEIAALVFCKCERDAQATTLAGHP